MTQTEILAWVASDLVHRTDQTAAIATGLTLAHRALQRDPIPLPSGNTISADWACQEKRTATADALVYAAASTDGIALPSDCKRPRALWAYDTASGGMMFIEAGTEVHHVVNSQFNADRGNSGRGAVAIGQRWFVRGGKLWLTHPPGTGDASLTFKLDYLCWLPYYRGASQGVEAITTDWFSENAAEALGYAAAFNVFVRIEAYDQAKAMKGLYDEARRAAWALDQEQRAGGVGGSLGYRPARYRMGDRR